MAQQIKETDKIALPSERYSKQLFDIFSYQNKQFVGLRTVYFEHAQ